MITKITIKNYRAFRSFSWECSSGLNIIVGNNESGKSTLLEAIGLALTRRVNGRFLESELSAYLFNKTAVAEYLAAIRAGEFIQPPSIEIELCFDDEHSHLAHLRGTNNMEREDCSGVRLEVVFNEEFADEYAKLLEDASQLRGVPTEYYRVNWYSFANAALSTRSLPLRLSFIDATALRLQSGTDFYLQALLTDGLDAKERAGLAMAYRQMKETFSEHAALKQINTRLEEDARALTDKSFSLALDVSSRGNWEASIHPHIDQLPFSYIGKGEQQRLKILMALGRQATNADIVLIEEPENHLSFSSLVSLLDRVREHCDGKQIFITTHSAYVLNKLGMSHVALLHEQRAAFLSDLAPDTQEYFRKLPGYDTLRLILAKRVILVEGPSDELFVQKAYWDRYGALPLAHGIDVLSTRGLSAPRFLEIAAAVGVRVAVVADNDGDYERNITKRFRKYEGHSNISICADPNNELQTLEDHVARTNGLPLMNQVLGSSFASEAELVASMKRNKTDWALAALDYPYQVLCPEYIQRAIA